MEGKVKEVFLEKDKNLHSTLIYIIRSLMGKDRYN